MLYLDNENPLEEDIGRRHPKDLSLYPKVVGRPKSVIPSWNYTDWGPKGWGEHKLAIIVPFRDRYLYL